MTTMRKRPEDAGFDLGDWRTCPDIRPDDPPMRDWKPLKNIENIRSQEGYLCQLWESDLYTVRVTFLPKSHGTLFGHEVVRLGIANADQSARRDWREFMQIKREILGPEWEAVELYPAESRAVDPSNYFLLYAILGTMEFGIFPDFPRLATAAEAIAPQRDFTNGAWPLTKAKGADRE